jgi:hypothetical protein
MKILQFSDWHVYYTPPNEIVKAVYGMGLQPDIDVIICCGDWVGGKAAPICVEFIMKKIRKIFPTIPVGAVLGNHDYWQMSKIKSVSKIPKIITKVKNVFEKHGVHFFDQDGPLVIGPNVFIGHTGWYRNPHPRTNDAHWMGGFEVHELMAKRASLEFDVNLNRLTSLYNLPSKKVIYVSHFGVIDDGVQDWKGGFTEFGGHPGIGDLMQKEFGCQTFLQGHAHTLRKGPLVWECGSDYRKPSFQVVEV